MQPSPVKATNNCTLSYLQSDYLIIQEENDLRKFDHNNWALYSQSRLKFLISNYKLTLKGIVLNNVTEVVTEFISSK